MPLFFQSLSLADRLDMILSDKSLTGAQVGVCIQDSSGKTLYERNSRQRFVPASNQKIITVLVAMDTLGPNYQGRTQIWRSPSRIDVATTGDPSLTLAKLRELGQQLKIKPNTPIYVNKAWQEAGPGWEWDDLPWYYAAPTTLFSADHSMFELFASDGKLERPARELGIKVNWWPGQTLTVEFDPGSSTFTIKGSLPKARTSLGKFAQPNPLQTAARALGGKFAGESTATLDRAPDAEIIGSPLANIAKECLEESDNNIAEQLFVMATSGAKDSYSEHAKLFKSMLVKLTNVDADLVRTVDGSGLSRHNQVAPLAICAILNYARTRPYWDQWERALAKSGEGTLKSRLTSSTFVGKTGTMDAIVSLSGYVTTKQGEKLTLSFLVNNSLVPASKVREVQDRLVQAVELGEPENGNNRHLQTAFSQIFPKPWYRPSVAYRVR